MAFSYTDFNAIAPIVTLFAFTVVVTIVEAFAKKSDRLNVTVSLIGLVVTSILFSVTIPVKGYALNWMVSTGGLSSITGLLFCLAAIATILLSIDYLRRNGSRIGEFNLLILFSTLGMALMTAANDLIVIFLGLEVMSICLYVLAGFFRKKPISNEASLKYILLGAFATGFLLYGIALIYGASGTTNITSIVFNFYTIQSSIYFWIGIVLLIVGLAFKIGAVPFHMWLPDVYQGSPTPVSGFMATGVKAAAFAALLIIFIHSRNIDSEKLRIIFAILSAASMIVGNIIAISQSNIKRMLAYSSIAHGGYMLAGVAALNRLGETGILFYLFIYTFMNIGAFGILSLLEKDEDKNLEFADYAGMGQRKPFIAALMTIFLFSLAGIPPFAGFFGKYYVFIAAINAHLTWLAILGVLMSVVSVYYYLRLVMMMYFRDGDVQLDEKLPAVSLAVLTVAAIAVIGLGFFPGSLLGLINSIY